MYDLIISLLSIIIVISIIGMYGLIILRLSILPLKCIITIILNEPNFFTISEIFLIALYTEIFFVFYHAFYLKYFLLT